MNTISLKRGAYISLGLLILSTAAGCARLRQGVNTASGIIGSAEDQALTKKLDTFIECINYTDSGLHRVYEEYLNGAPVANKKKHRSATFSGFRSPAWKTDKNSVNKCISGLEQGINEAPHIDDLDKRGREYSVALKKLEPLMDEADTYYQQKNYKDDNFAKGEQMHGPLTAAFEEYIKVSDEMRATVDRYDEDLKQRQLAELERTGGRNLTFLSNNLMMQARHLFKAGNKEKPTREELQPALDEYTKAYEEAKRYAENHSDEAQPTKGGGWFYLNKSAELFLTEAKELDRDLRDKRSAEDLQNRLQRFVYNYNALINNYNMALGMTRPAAR